MGVWFFLIEVFGVLNTVALNCLPEDEFNSIWKWTVLYTPLEGAGVFLFLSFCACTSELVLVEAHFVLRSHD